MNNSVQGGGFAHPSILEHLPIQSEMLLWVFTRSTSGCWALPSPLGRLRCFWQLGAHGQTQDWARHVCTKTPEKSHLKRHHWRRHRCMAASLPLGWLLHWKPKLWVRLPKPSKINPLGNEEWNFYFLQQPLSILKGKFKKP